MTVDSYRPPTIRAILGGCLLTLLLLVPFLFISNVVKLVGVPFLVLPHTLGLLPAASAEDVRHVDLSSSPSRLDLPAAGPYLVYTDNHNLLEITLQLELAQAPPWLRISDAQARGVVPVDYVERGLMPYDPLIVPGRPIFRFVVNREGSYVVEHLSREVSLAVLPDTTTGRELEMLLAAVVQAGAVVLLVSSILRRRARARAARLNALLAPGRMSPKELQRRHARGDEPPAREVR